MAKAATKVEATEDHIDAFEKHMERLVGLAENAEFEEGTLVGDIRDTMLDIFKNRPKPWSSMSESEMRDVNKALENVAKIFIRKVVLIVAEEDLVSVRATLKGYSAKGDVFKLNAEARGDEDTALELFRMDGHDVVIMSADAQRFIGQKADGEVQPDQPALFSDEPPAGEPGDVDLVEAAEEESTAEQPAEQDAEGDDNNGAAPPVDA